MTTCKKGLNQTIGAKYVACYGAVREQNAQNQDSVSINARCQSMSLRGQVTLATTPIPDNTMNTNTHQEHVMATSIRIAPDIERRLDFLAAQTGRTKAYYLREIIEKSIEEMEDYYLAVDVLERIRKGEETVHSAADVRKALGLED